MIMSNNFSAEQCRNREIEFNWRDLMFLVKLSWDSYKILQLLLERSTQRATRAVLIKKTRLRRGTDAVRDVARVSLISRNNLQVMPLFIRRKKGVHVALISFDTFSVLRAARSVSATTCCSQSRRCDRESHRSYRQAARGKVQFPGATYVWFEVQVSALGRIPYAIFTPRNHEVRTPVIERESYARNGAVHW